MIKNRIALKLLVFFAAALLFFALVSSLTFRQLFTESIKESKRAEMLDRASYLSGMLSQALEGTRSGGAMAGGQRSGTSTEAGCRSNVTRTGGKPRVRAKPTAA